MFNQFSTSRNGVFARRSTQLSLCLFWVSLYPATLEARLTRTVIEAVRPLPVVAGEMPYELVSGTFFGTLSPSDPHNRIITDIANAPRNERGLVNYSATFSLFRPVDSRKANGLLFYDAPNRGYGIEAAPENDGRVRVMSGWQGDIAPAKGLHTATVPIAKGVTGPVLARMIDISATAKSIPIIGGFGRITPKPLPVSLDTSKARLVIERRDKPDEPVAAAAWAFADCSTVPFPGTPDPAQLCVRDGFDPNAAYTLSYRGKDPQILGIGFAATRDLVAFLRGGKADDVGTANPAVGPVRWAVASGTSQSGNFLRSFIHLGFNADEQGKRLFDGINDHIAARQVPLNLRFGVPGGTAGRYDPGSEGTQWWGRYDDKVRGRGVSSLLDRCAASHTCPVIIETFGAAEIWGLRASLGMVGTDAKKDIPLPATVRRYYFPSVTHAGGRGSGFAVNGDAIPPGCTLRGNPNPVSDSFHVAIRYLIAWVKDGKEPPASRYPTLAGGDLVDPAGKAMGWPAIPGAPLPDGKINGLTDYDFGPTFRYGDVSGAMARLPPRERRNIALRVPRVNADGNETSGVPSVQLQVPLGTYTGWNVTEKGYDAGNVCGFNGSFIPFSKTKAEREASGDPRLSLAERYSDHAGFVAKVREAVARQQADGWLLPDDAARIIANAAASDVLR
jgi:Alpha/beta hydrolase domain